ncbi:uncharacterized protein RHO25_010784 [Cercospora beticola]|uniref:Uncharacterized protein n=1 Tax=Cercospora beticola TaxID=122368 RepID=A0ABZ0P2P5_CERBT|nr:hypothetical protein RHO25_010784 [Cercospora beticola]
MASREGGDRYSNPPRFESLDLEDGPPPPPYTSRRNTQTTGTAPTNTETNNAAATTSSDSAAREYRITWAVCKEFFKHPHHPQYRPFIIWFGILVVLILLPIVAYLTTHHD